MLSRIRLKRTWTKTQWTRLAVQLLFLVVTAYALIRHRINSAAGLSGPSNPAPGVDSLSPFGGLETMWSYVTTGQLLKHIHFSDLILFGAAVLLVLLLGSAFCGWICPFGAIQEWLYRLRAKLVPWKITIPQRVDRVLRYGRYVVLALILFATYSAGEMIFGDYCPWRAAWELGSEEIAIGGAIVLGLVVVGGLLVERAWCLYACPLGAVLGVANKLTPVKLRRTDSACKACGICNKRCPLNINVDSVAAVTDTTCNRCLECVDSCPKDEALDVKAGRRRIAGPVYGLLVAGIFGGVILLSMATGVWEATAQAKPPTPDAATGLVSSAELKGWRTLQEVTDVWGVPSEVLYRELGTDPASLPPSTQIKQLEGKTRADGTVLDRVFVQSVIDRYRAGELK